MCLKSLCFSGQASGRMTGCLSPDKSINILQQRQTSFFLNIKKTELGTLVISTFSTERQIVTLLHFLLQSCRTPVSFTVLRNTLHLAKPGIFFFYQEVVFNNSLLFISASHLPSLSLNCTVHMNTFISVNDKK